MILPANCDWDMTFPSGTCVDDKNSFFSFDKEAKPILTVDSAKVWFRSNYIFVKCLELNYHLPPIPL
jgi:hypothetical protein